MVRLKGDLWLVAGRRGGRYPHCNSLLIDSGERALIDPGSNKKVLRSLARDGVGTVFLSHFHSDHVRELKEFPGSSAMIHKIEEPAMQGWQGMAPLVWFPEEERDATWIKRKDREVGGWGWPVSGTFTGGEKMAVGDVEMEIIHTPGHTPGHCCFWFPNEKVLFSADVDITDFGPWYGNAASSVDDFVESIEKLKNYDPETTVTGHEAGVIDGEIAHWLDTYSHEIDARHQRILDFLTGPRTLEEVTEKGFIYGDHFSRSFYQPEWRMARHHLEMAVKKGEAEKTEEGKYKTS